MNKDIPVWTEDPLSDTVNLKQVLEQVEKIVPSYFFRYIQAVRIGMFDEMGSVYVSDIVGEYDG